MSMEKKKALLLNAGCTLVVMVILYLVWRYLLPAFWPFIIAFLFAALIFKGTEKIAGALKLPEKAVAAVLTTLFFSALAVIILASGSRLFLSAAEVIGTLPTRYREEFLPWINTLIEELNERYRFMEHPWFYILESGFEQWSQKLGNWITDVSVSAVQAVSGYVIALPSAIIRVVVTIVATYFMALDYRRITGFCMSMLPEKGQSMVRQVAHKTKEVILIYLKSYSILMAITFAELCLGLFVLKVPYFGLIAFCIAIFDILPVVGTGGILLPWSVIALILGDYKIAVGILVLYLCITAIRNSLEPRIVGKQIGLHPLVTLISLVVGLKLFGLAGLIGIPVALSILVNLRKEGVVQWPPLEKENEH